MTRRSTGSTWLLVWAVAIACSENDRQTTTAEAPSALTDGQRVRLDTTAPSEEDAQELGVIVRLRGAPMLARWAQAGSARSAARTATEIAGARAAAADQHRRFRAASEAALHKSARAIRYEDFYDAINAVALHGVSAEDAAAAFAGNAEVLSIEPIQKVAATLLDSVPLLDADDVWALGDSNGVPIDGMDMRIGILDTGVDYTHPDLGGCFGGLCKVAGGYDFVNYDADPMDDNGHGTHAAATAAGNGTYQSASGPAPLRGVAPGARIYAYKVLNSSGFGASTMIISGIERCADPNHDGNPADHLDVCSMSLGGSGNPDDSMSIAVDNATLNGVVFTVAAGNSGPSAQTIGSPGTSRQAITVAAACKPSQIGVDSQCAQAIASSSSRGPVVWTAGGVQQTLAKPDVAAYGVKLCAAEWGTYQSGSRCLDGQHVALSGTSTAAPEVAGVAALLRQAHPEWTPADVKSFLASGAVSLGLDSTIQGAGVVNALNSLNLGGVPPNVALLSGLPLRDTTVPTSRYGSAQSDLGITNTTASELTYTPSLVGADPGLAVSFSPASLTLAPGQTGSISVLRTVDHDLVASRAAVEGMIVLSTAAGEAKARVQMAVGDRLQAAPASIDLGVYLASQPSWTGQQQITLTNTRTDVETTYTATSSIQNPPTSVSSSLSAQTITLPPGGSAVLTLTVTATGALNNVRINGTVQLTSALQAVSVPFTFFKGYALAFDFAGQKPMKLSLTRTSASPVYYSPTAPTLTLYLADPGPYFAEAEWSTPYHVIAADIQTDVPIRAVTMDKATATHKIDLKPVDRTGATIYGTFNTRLTHLATGSGIMEGLGPLMSDWLWVSDVPASYTFTAAWVARSSGGELNAATWEVPGPITSDVLLTTTPADFVSRDVRVARKNGPWQGVLYPWACLTGAYSSNPAGIGDVGTTCATHMWSSTPVPSSGIVRVNFYSNVQRDVFASDYPYAPSTRFDLTTESVNPVTLYRGPYLLVNATREFSWSNTSPVFGTPLGPDAQRLVACDEHPAGALQPFFNGPLVGTWGFHNYRTSSFSFRTVNGYRRNAFEYDGCVSDGAASTGNITYSLYRDGALVSSGAIADTNGLDLPKVSGEHTHRFELRRTAVFSDVTTQVESVSTFTLSSTRTIDENPPMLEALHLLAHGTWQEVLDPATVNRVKFRLSPVPGYAAYNPGTVPEYPPMADALGPVTLEYSADGTTWSSVPLTDLGGGEFQSDAILVDPAVALHSLRISASDAAGNTFTHRFQVPRGTAWAAQGADVTGPAVSIASPAAGATVAAMTSVSVAASDASSIARVQLFIDGALFGEKTAAPFTWDWNTDLVSEGPHQLRARAFDGAENLADATPVSVTVDHNDTTPPTVSITAPLAGAVIGQSATVSADAQDYFGVARVDFFSDGASIGSAAATPWSMTWNAALAADGDHALTAVATDGSGNAGTSAPVVVTVDHTGPGVSVTAPVDGALVRGSVSVTATASDLHGVSLVEFLADGVVFGSASAEPYSATWSPGADGAHALAARALDIVGNPSTSAGVNVTVDNTGPALSLTSPASGALVRGTVALAADATDPAGIDRVEFLVDGTFAGVSLVAPYSFGWPSGPDGAHSVSAHAFDLLGNSSATAGRSITVDNTAPTVSVTAPASNAWARGTVSLSASASDPSGLSRVDFYVDGALVGSDTTAPFSIAWSSTTVADGAHAITAQAVDAAGNSATSTPVNANVDNTAPSASVTAPANGATLTGTVTVSANAADASGVSRVDFYAGATSIGSDLAAPFSISWNSSQVANGSYAITARATDPAGNVQTSSAVQVTVSNASPYAQYDAVLRAPKCASVGNRCSSGSLLTGRGTMGPEVNQPNTLYGSCADGTGGTFHVDESLDALEIASSGEPFAPGVTVTVTATVWAWSSGASDVLELYSAPDATSPVWTLRASIVPPGGGARTLSTTFVLPQGGTVQAIRGRFRYGGSAGSCGASSYTDHDDLAFAVGGGTPPDTTPPTTSLTSPAEGAVLSGTATVNATASDDRAVTRVDFYAGATLIGTDTLAPYAVSWDTATLANGSYVLTSRAFDAAGNSAISAGVNVTVDNWVPSELINGGFEGTASPWILTGAASHVPTAGPAHSGTGHLLLGGSVSTTGTAYQAIAIPAGTAPSLSFWLYVTTAEPTTTTQWDRLYAEVTSTSGTLLGTLATYSNLDLGTGYVLRGNFSLASFAGQTVRIQFRATNDSVYQTTFRIDDASVQ